MKKYLVALLSVLVLVAAPASASAYQHVENAANQCIWEVQHDAANRYTQAFGNWGAPPNGHWEYAASPSLVSSYRYGPEDVAVTIAYDALTSNYGNTPTGYPVYRITYACRYQGYDGGTNGWYVHITTFGFRAYTSGPYQIR